MQLNPLRVRSLAVGFLAASAAVVVLAAIFLVYCAYTLPLSRTSASDAPPAAVLYTAATGAPFAARGVYHGEPLAADHLPRDLANAVVAIEDRRFYHHRGIDLRGILRAAWHNLWRSGRVEGGSTITQQLARSMFLSPERSLRRKVQEMMLALWLESRLSKQEILARYLNSIYFGAGAVGADAAARRYFGKPAMELDLAQSAMLAGLIRAPSQLSPSRNLAGARQRSRLVLAAMVRSGMIDKPQAAQAGHERVRLALAPEPLPADNYFVDAADAEVKRLVGTPPLDLTVTTTFDPHLQDAAERVVSAWLGGEGARRHVGQAALVAMAPDGAILALVGGRDYRESQFNRATQARRQPGSLFKMFVYLTALSSGYGPNSVVVDQPVQIGDWQPKNYDGRYRGPVTLRTAFAQSINSVAVQLVQAIGVDRVIATARSLGIEADLPAVPSLALGVADVSLLEMTRAMDTIATDTKSIEPYMVRAIRTPASPLYARPETSTERPEWQAARTPMMQLLEAVVSEGTGQAARLDRRAAGKTGTTDDYRDAWFVGFTTDLIVGVWVGNDDNSPMDGVTGGDIPARMWHDFMVEAERILARPKAPVAEALTGSSAQTATAAAVANRVAPVTSTEAPALPLRGTPHVIDSATLEVDGAVVHLEGVQGEAGEPARELAQYVGDRAVVCLPVNTGAAQYRCKLGEYDISEAVLLNGAGRVADNAPASYRAAEEKARTAGRGIWRR